MLFFFCARDPQVAFCRERVCVHACQRYTGPQSQCGGGSSGHLLYLLNPSITCARTLLSVGNSHLSVLFLCETVILRELTPPTCPNAPPLPTLTVTPVLICHSCRASDFRHARKKNPKQNKQFGVTINAALESSAAQSMQFWCRLGDSDRCLHRVVISVADLEVKFNFPTTASMLPCNKKKEKRATAVSRSHFLHRSDRV